MPRACDIAGVRFFRLVAVSPTDQRMDGSVVWLCLCDCGRETKVNAKKLHSGNTRSCGCLRREVSIANARIGSDKARKPRLPCVVCGKPRRYRANLAYCSPQCHGGAQRGRGTRGYVKRGARHEHRIVAEQTLGRPLRKGEVVHHKDEDKHNNSPDNLEVLSQAEHMQRHGIGIPGQTLWWKPWEKRSKRNVENV